MLEVIHKYDFIAELEKIKEQHPEAADLIEEIEATAEDESFEAIDPEDPPIR